MGEVDNMRVNIQGKADATHFLPAHLTVCETGAAIRFNAASIPAEYATAMYWWSEGRCEGKQRSCATGTHFACLIKQGERFSRAIEDLPPFWYWQALRLTWAIAHGPFANEYELELIQAFDDFNNGKFGTFGGLYQNKDWFTFVFKKILLWLYLENKMVQRGEFRLF